MIWLRCIISWQKRLLVEILSQAKGDCRIMVQQLLKWVSILVFLLSSSVLFAQNDKVYKVVDANGKVRFSSTPPVNGQAAADIEEIAIKSASSNKTTVTEIGDNAFCGEIQLPTWPNKNSGRFSDEKRRFYIDLASSKKNWESKVERIEKDAHRVERSRFGSSSEYFESSNHGKNNTPESLEKARDYRCAIAWADEKQDELQKMEQTLVSKIEESEKYMKMQAAISSRDCGDKPEITDNADLDRLKSAWKKCTQSYHSSIEDAMSERESMNKELELIYRAQQANRGG